MKQAYYCLVLFCLACLFQYIFIKTIGYDPGMELAAVPIILFQILINVLLAFLFIAFYKRYKPWKVFFVLLILVAMWNCSYVFFFSGRDLFPGSAKNRKEYVQNYFHVYLRLVTPEPDSTAEISITKNNRLYPEIKSRGKECAVDLELNSCYLVTCTQKGYISKTVYFDTRVPKGQEYASFTDFEADVKLSKGNSETVIPAGGIKYDLQSREFQLVK